VLRVEIFEESTTLRIVVLRVEIFEESTTLRIVVLRVEIFEEILFLAHFPANQECIKGSDFPTAIIL
jgi:hypothetical protein